MHRRKTAAHRDEMRARVRRADRSARTADRPVELPKVSTVDDDRKARRRVRRLALARSEGTHFDQSGAPQ